MRLLLDTNACIEILRGKNTTLLARYSSQPRTDIALSAIVRSGLLTGALLSAKPAENRQIAESFCALFPCLAFDSHVADIHGGMARAPAPSWKYHRRKRPDDCRHGARAQADGRHTQYQRISTDRWTDCRGLAGVT